ncbi:MAG: VOC family protein [Anaerolinea sp.]|nr:VOC family protein [Anaerolinea sp.]
MQKITPFLWFDGEAEEAMNFYVGLFPNSRIMNVSRYNDAIPAMSGKVLTCTFELDGVQFTALNGGPEFKFNEAISFYVDCADQAEVDRLWSALTANGGEESQCGWLKDRFGVSWQIVPRALTEMMNDANPLKAQRVTESMLQMKKIDVAELRRAYESV